MSPFVKDNCTTTVLHIQLLLGSQLRRQHLQPHWSNISKVWGVCLFFIHSFLFTALQLCSLTLLFEIYKIEASFSVVQGHSDHLTLWSSGRVLHDMMCTLPVSVHVYMFTRAVTPAHTCIRTNTIYESQLLASADWGSQLELVSYFGGYILETNGSAWYPLESHTIKRESGQFAHLHFPLH